MNGRKTIALGFFVAALAAGCASAPPTFPDPRESVVTVSTRTVEQGEQYAIPGSQVYLSGTSKMGGMATAATMGGLFGYGVGSAVDQARNRLALEGREAALVVRYEELVAQRLREAGGIQVGKMDDRSARVRLAPAANLIRTEKGALLMCTIEAQYSVAGVAAMFTHRTYRYVFPGVRPLVGSGDGWTDDGGARFREASQSAMKALADAFAADWNGRFAKPGEARAVRWQREGMKEPRAGVLLYEVGEYAIVADGNATSAVTTNVAIIERSSLVQ